MLRVLHPALPGMSMLVVRELPYIIIFLPVNRVENSFCVWKIQIKIDMLKVLLRIYFLRLNNSE